jgi:MATE family multidrug resistance protein
MAVREQVKTTFLLAYPVMLSQLGQVAVGVADSMMVGRLGALELAASSLANSIFFVVLMFGIGISMGLTPLVAKAYGKGKTNQISRLFGNSLLINFFASLILFGVVLLFGQYVSVLNQPEAVEVLALPFLLIITASLIPLMVFQAFKQFVEGLSQTKQAMFITIAANLLNVFLNWLLIWGHWGFPELGFLGAAWATLISRVVMMVLMGAYVLTARRYAEFEIRIFRVKPTWTLCQRILKIGIPTGFQFIFEVSAFSAAAIMMGWISVNALAGHQIALNLASISYMMATGLATAGMVRVSNFIGKGDLKGMREAGMVAFGMVATFMFGCALLFFALRFFLPTLYIDDPQVISLAATLLVLAGFFQLSDGLQVVGLGVLRGLEDVKVPTIVTFFAYWGLGLPLGYVLAIELDFAEKGIWMGLLIGLTLTAGMLLFRFDRLSKLKIKRQEEPIVGP